MKNNLILHRKRAKKLKSFVKRYITEITTQKDNNFNFQATKYINQKAYEPDQNQMTLSVLDLLRNMLRFGLYQDPEDFSKSKLLGGIFKLLNGCYDVTHHDEEEWLELADRYQDIKPNQKYNAIEPVKKQGIVYRLRTRYHPEIEGTILMMECKNRICEILNIIFDIRNEFRVSRFLMKYKMNSKRVKK